MAVREIKTTLALDGEKEFKREMEEASRQMRVMNADLKAMAAEYETTNDAQRYFADRSETLNNKIEQQKEIVRALSEAVKDSAEKYGDAAKQTDGYRIKLSNATEQLFKMRKEAEEAEREMEDLGRDSNKIGRQIENGIGDAAEDVSEKLDGMFDKVASDISALKGSVAWQTTMNVGEFVMEGVNSVIDFVNENQELNRTIAITRHNIEQYGFKWEDVQDLIIRASAITGNQEGAFEAISNLAGAGFESIELMEAAMQALLGAFIQTGGSLSFESLAEDFRASVVSRVPTGTYAEVLEEVLKGITIEEVEKAFQKVENDQAAIELALAYLTKGGMQTTTVDFEKQNEELLENQRKAAELAFKYAELSQEIAPIVSGLTDLTMDAVDELIEMVKTLKENYATLQAIMASPETTVFNREWNQQQMQEYDPTFTEAVQSGQLDTMSGTFDYFKEKLNEWFSNLFPSAGAEEIPPEWGEYGATTFEAYETGMQNAADESTAGTDAATTVVDDLSSADGNAETAGKNTMIHFANGIADGADYVYNNVRTIIDSVNSMLNQVAVPAWASGGYYGGGGANPNQTATEKGTAVLYIDGQRAGELLYSGLSRAGGRAVQTKMLVD